MAQKTKLPPVNVFVYGTLKQGHKLHEWMNGSKFVSFDELPGHTLIDLGPYPAMVKISGGYPSAFETQGEVYEMPGDFFAQLREMEENVGYRTVDVVTRKGHKAHAFIFADLTPGLASWVLGSKHNKARVEVKLDDKIPF